MSKNSRKFDLEERLIDETNELISIFVKSVNTATKKRRKKS